ncbi:sugar phosphate isomerase/epimerase [Candidatus Poribacteria bacterium]|jgi:sugar phosphate isomerase/epimerase|nr:sugar phosphate isomerase/epimerase [Candidatus Poribacteria bacterium]MBT5534122.1 sugar phosphate isomerase/epimerase [Candidatus Poribacteria bacterium]MBT5713669.1 sugar phosphate isomerase/epimerase [Candidatus Poribacteria bacterium]MBT7101110.1 sugar phosphate isomerase/epimerase [Candidatus Poribacteria bacterium]MBT7807246.1 sugar phosphate isomerase/epimerase [Candidatus Poribacteria bacterium]
MSTPEVDSRADIKVGCLSWCFHPFSPGADPSEAIDIIGELGFDGVELILLAREDVNGYWTDARVDTLRRQLDGHGLEAAQFVLFQPVVAGLASADRDERAESLRYFEEGCRIGRMFDAPIINIVAPWPVAMRGPVDYLPRYYDLPDAAADEKFHIGIADGFDWDEVWAAYIEATTACLDCAKSYGMRFTIEHHTHTMIPDATSFLRLWDAVGDPDLGYNMDVGWTLSQREYPPLAVHKTKSQLMNVHMRDIDGLMRSFVHVGEGVMDFAAVVDTLRDIGYRGYVSLEQDKHEGDMRATCARYLALMRECLA